MGARLHGIAAADEDAVDAQLRQRCDAIVVLRHLLPPEGLHVEVNLARGAPRSVSERPRRQAVCPHCGLWLRCKRGSTEEDRGGQPRGGGV